MESNAIAPDLQALFWQYAAVERIEADDAEFGASNHAIYRALANDANRQALRLHVFHAPERGADGRHYQHVAVVSKAAALSHPNIVPIVAYGARGEYIHVAEEWIEGESLAHALRQYSRIAEKHALLWLRQAAEALDEAHAAGVVHGTLSPEACLIDRAGRMHVRNWGLLHALPRGAARAYYLACEAPTPACPPPTTKDDQFALAALSFEVLTGRPLPSADSTALFRFSARAALAQHMPAASGVVVSRGLSTDPESRYPTCVAFVDALALAAGVSSRATPAAGAYTDTATDAPSGAATDDARTPGLGAATVIGGLIALGVVAGVAYLMTGDLPFLSTIGELLRRNLLIAR